MKEFKFEIVKKSSEVNLARVGKITTPHGEILTPCFVPVGTKASVKGLQVSDLLDIGAQSVLANTYHLYLQPGKDRVEKNGGFPKMMSWVNNEKKILPSWTDSGGFQVLSLGAAYGTGVTKIATSSLIPSLSPKEKGAVQKNPLAKIDEEGVTFKSIIDGSLHRFTPEISMQIQHSLGADIFFAFDECTSPLATYEYQISAMERTHLWALRCILEHKRLGVSNATGAQQALFGVVQGSGYTDLREQSAKFMASLDFDGYGIGGSFTKSDIKRDVSIATSNLPENKPRHLLGMGEDPIDIFEGVEAGIDTFDCVSPTRLGRHGSIYTENGRVDLTQSKYKDNFNKITTDVKSPLFPFTYSYLSHLFRSKEMLGAILASKHNLYFLISLTSNIRQSILEDRFVKFKKDFCGKYYAKLTV